MSGSDRITMQASCASWIPQQHTFGHWIDTAAHPGSTPPTHLEQCVIVALLDLARAPHKYFEVVEHGPAQIGHLVGWWG